MSTTMAEALAIAVLKGDTVAVFALRDRLNEEYAGMPLERAAETLKSRPAHDGYEVFHWPEFQALAIRLGVIINLRTVEVTIRLAIGEPVDVQHKYRGADTSERI